MNSIKKIASTIFLWVLVICSAYGQSNGAHYYFDGNEVVFEFSRQAYFDASANNKPDALIFKDLEILEILVLEKENPEKRKGWMMTRINNDTYQLRKNILEFGTRFSGQHKFLINKKYWLTPIDAQDTYLCPDDIVDQVYNESPYKDLQKETGNVTFSLPGHPFARNVILSGSFNGWNEDKPKMKKKENHWEITLNLPLGRYEYKFIIDGNWTHDENNVQTVKNEHGTLNSVIDLRNLHQITLRGFDNAKTVKISGTFNGWSRDVFMIRSDHEWIFNLDLSPGKYFYKFVVDGNWITDPLNPYTERDFMGNTNSVIIVR